jgi:hypothetical protein
MVMGVEAEWGNNVQNLLETAKTSSFAQPGISLWTSSFADTEGVYSTYSSYKGIACGALFILFDGDCVHIYINKLI